jgi:hyperosmotically inducible periplasmic protein
MRILSTISMLAVASLMLGCNKDSTDQTSTDGTTSTDRSTSERTGNLEPTARDSQSSVYSDTNQAGVKADNSGKNVRDRAPESLTPEEQGGSEADREVTRNIRRAITAQDALSVSAKNIKIITVNGKVTLRGPVASEQEKQTIAAEAQRVAGSGTVDNQLEIKPADQ